MDWFRSQHPNTGWNMGAGNAPWGGQTPGNMQAWGQPSLSSYGSLAALRRPPQIVR